MTSYPNQPAFQQVQDTAVQNSPKRSSASSTLEAVAHFIDPLFALRIEFKLFVLSCLAQHQRTGADIDSVIDVLDPDALIDASCCDLIEQICNEPQLHLFAILNFLAVDLVTDQLAAQEPSPIGSPHLCN